MGVGRSTGLSEPGSAGPGNLTRIYSATLPVNYPPLLLSWQGLGGVAGLGGRARHLQGHGTRRFGSPFILGQDQTGGLLGFPGSKRWLLASFHTLTLLLVGLRQGHPGSESLALGPPSALWQMGSSSPSSSSSQARLWEPKGSVLREEPRQLVEEAPEPGALTNGPGVEPGGDRTSSAP